MTSSMLLLLAIPAASPRAQVMEEPELPPCVTIKNGEYREPYSFNDLVRCQKKAKTEYLYQYNRTFGKDPSPKQLEILELTQKQESEDYVKRNSDPDFKRRKRAKRPRFFKNRRKFKEPMKSVEHETRKEVESISKTIDTSASLEFDSLEEKVSKPKKKKRRWFRRRRKDKKLESEYSSEMNRFLEDMDSETAHE